jgi:nucleotide-binding universal stress UspA family protein
MTAQLWQTAPVHWDDPARAVVVGVDGSEANRAAVAYAAHEAEDTGRPLTLVASMDEFEVGIPHYSVASNGDDAFRALTEIRAEIHHDHPDLTVNREMDFGSTVRCLLDRSVEQGRLVVGKRGAGAFSRIMAGSVSIGVAGRSRVPVIVVPAGWDDGTHAGEPVVVAISPHKNAAVALGFAFAEASRRQAPLTVVHVADIRPVAVWYPLDGAAAYQELLEPEPGVFARTVQPFEEQYGDVKVTLHEERGHPTSVVLDRSAGAQLLVLGRSRRTRTGFELGSVTRGVLHHSEIPVAVVPSPSP